MTIIKKNFGSYQRKVMHLNLKIIVLCIFSLKAFSQTTPDSLLRILVNNEQKLVDGIAAGDKKLWDEFLHDSCIISIENGTVISKQKMVEGLNPLPAGYVGRIQVIEPKLKLYGNTAVISFVDDEYLTLFNQHIHTRYRQTNTWMSINGEWKVISMQLFEIPKNPPPIVLDSNVLKRYAGEYALSPEKKATVYVKNGKLYAKKGSSDPRELFAQTENVFFRNGDGRVDIIFMKENSGSYKMIERREGEDLVWKRL